MHDGKYDMMVEDDHRDIPWDVGGLDIDRHIHWDDIQAEEVQDDRSVDDYNDHCLVHHSDPADFDEARVAFDDNGVDASL